MDELKSISHGNYVPRYNMAMVYNGLGNSAEALRWLERAYEERDVHLVYVAVDPKWDGLRKDPAFAGLLQRMNFPQ